MKTAAGTLLIGVAALAGCELPPHPPDVPTWADVEPILRANCNHCHGGTARETGSVGALVYRFDFYEMTDSVCGDAAQALEAPSGLSMARGWAASIRTGVTPQARSRPRMPPAPAQPLAEWEWQTLARWADAPGRGPTPRTNGVPRMQVKRFPITAHRSLSFVAIIDDPDGESVVGVIQAGDVVFKMDRPGSFAVEMDTSAWEEGSVEVKTILCDGWNNVTYTIGRVEIRH